MKTSDAALNSSQNQTSTSLLTDIQVGRQLGISVATLRRWRLLRTGPTYTKLGASVRYREEDVRAYIESNLRLGTNTHESEVMGPKPNQHDSRGLRS
jgi:predicted DNA-binding transcriptional regulator AlpA